MAYLRDWEKELEERVAFVRALLEESHTTGIVYGNSGGKDSVLVGAICKKACDNTVGIIMPCASRRNYESDTEDGLKAAEKYGIETRTVDLTPAREAIIAQIKEAAEPTDAAISNIAPRLRMTTLYTIGQSENRLVAGTGNRSEIYMGYFTKWGDGAHDFNPISDLTVTEIYDFLAYLGAPESILTKAPSAGLFEGQTDEAEMGITYKAIDHFLETGEATPEELAILERYHSRSEHKRKGIARFKEVQD